MQVQHVPFRFFQYMFMKYCNVNYEDIKNRFAKYNMKNVYEIFESINSLYFTILSFQNIKFVIKWFKDVYNTNLEFEEYSSFAYKNKDELEKECNWLKVSKVYDI